jgi:integrase
MKIFKRTDGKWTFDFTRAGKRYKRVIGSSKCEALEAMEALKTDLVRERYGFGRKKPEVLFETHADEFLKLYSKQNKRSWMSDETSLSHLKEFFKGKHLSDITPDLIEKYKLKRAADGVSPATINRELACLKTLFVKAVEWGKTDADPARKVKKLREPKPRERILTVEEMKRLLDTASPELRPVLIIALNTGMRRGEILGLRWKDIDFVKGFILIADSKSGRSRKVPMNGLVFETLRAMNREREFVFENPETRTNIKDVKTAFKGACARAKKNPKDENDKGIEGLRFHDLRHTAASRMIELGADLVTVSKILGHASIGMTMRYCHPTTENIRLAVGKLGEVFGETRKPPVSVEIRRPASYLKTDN